MRTSIVQQIKKIIEKSTMFNTHLIFFICFALVLCVNIFVNYKENLENWIEILGTILQIAIPAYSLVPIFWKEDTNGAKQMAKVLCVTLIVTWSFKIGLGDLLGINEIRPNGGRWSFPSGHTAGAFSGVVFLTLRYGLKYALISLPLAIFVAFSRIYSHVHWSTDVYASIFLCVIMGLLFVRPFKKGFS